MSAIDHAKTDEQPHANRCAVEICDLQEHKPDGRSAKSKYRV
jgi:hypothetical protein